MSVARLSAREHLARLMPPGVDPVVGAVTLNGDTVHSASGNDATVYRRPFDDDPSHRAVNPSCVVRCQRQTFLRARRLVAASIKANSSPRPIEQHHYAANPIPAGLSKQDRARHRAALADGIRAYCASVGGGSGGASARLSVRSTRECIVDYLESISLSAEEPGALERRRSGSRSAVVGCPCIMSECDAKGRAFGDDFACRTCMRERYLPLALAADVLASLAIQDPDHVPDLRAFYTHGSFVRVSAGEAVAQFIDECISITFGAKFSGFIEWVHHCLVQACCALIEAPSGSVEPVVMPVLAPLPAAAASPVSEERLASATAGLLALPGAAPANDSADLSSSAADTPVFDARESVPSIGNLPLSRSVFRFTVPTSIPDFMRDRVTIPNAFSIRQSM